MGKLIVIEGTDGSGKSTQFRLLTQRLENENIAFRKIVFPQYSEPSSTLMPCSSICTGRHFALLHSYIWLIFL